MHADDIIQHAHPADAEVGDDTYPGATWGWNQGDTAGVWQQKRRNSKESGLAEHIRRHGVKGPVTLSFDDHHEFSAKSLVLVDGHHRVASASLANQFVPVKYEDD